MTKPLSTLCPTCHVHPGVHCVDSASNQVGLHSSRRRLEAGRIESAEDFAGALTAKFASQPAYTGKIFKVDPRGQKYIRVTQETDGVSHSLSVHCFVERATGHVLKASGWKVPAKGVRFTTMFAAFEASDIFGSYLYKR